MFKAALYLQLFLLGFLFNMMVRLSQDPVPPDTNFTVVMFGLNCFTTMALLYANAYLDKRKPSPYN